MYFCDRLHIFMYCVLVTRVYPQNIRLKHLCWNLHIAKYGPKQYLKPHRKLELNRKGDYLGT